MVVVKMSRFYMVVIPVPIDCRRVIVVVTTIETSTEVTVTVVSKANGERRPRIRVTAVSVASTISTIPAESTLSRSFICAWPHCPHGQRCTSCHQKRLHNSAPVLGTLRIETTCSTCEGCAKSADSSLLGKYREFHSAPRRTCRQNGATWRVIDDTPNNPADRLPQLRRPASRVSDVAMTSSDALKNLVVAGEFADCRPQHRCDFRGGTQLARDCYRTRSRSSIDCRSRPFPIREDRCSSGCC